MVLFTEVLMYAIKRFAIFIIAFAAIMCVSFLLSDSSDANFVLAYDSHASETESSVPSTSVSTDINTTESATQADVTQTATVPATAATLSNTTTTKSEYKRKSVKIKSVKVKKLNAKVSWHNLENAEKYEVFIFKKNKWKKIKSTHLNYYTIKDLENYSTYSVRVRAVVSTPYGRDYSYFSESRDFEINETKLYNLRSANLLSRKKKVKKRNVSGYYTGYASGKYKGYILIDYNYGTYLVKRSKVKIVKGAKVLSTSAVSQINGKYRGWSACGPATATILLNSEKKADLRKDDLIRVSKIKHLEDQGSVTKTGGGITSPKLIKLIKHFGYNAKNLYKNSIKPSKIIKKQIDSGKRCLVLVKYSGGIMPNSGAAHFVVICGYKKIGGKLYFYYADPYYSSAGGRSLLSVSSTLINRSVSRKFSEPNTVLVLE